MITGSLYVADTLETGIAISGLKDTGFVRSLGYSGFEYDDPGFLLWSGSALSGSSGTKGGVPYSGVGLELYANTDNYFRFSTTDSELDVRTQKFFVGNATTFLSGSDGNLQIKSGNDLNIYNGEITGSNVLISNTIKTGTSTTEDYIVLSTAQRVVDASNIARIVYQDESLSQDTQHTTAVSSPYTSSNVLLASFTCNILPGETNMVFMFQVSGSISGSSSQISDSQFVDPYLKIDLSYISASAGPVETLATSPNFRIITPIETLETYEFSGSMHDGYFGSRLKLGGTSFSSGDFVQMYKPINGDMQGKFVKVEMYERLRIQRIQGSNSTNSGSLNWRNLHVMTTRQANEFQSIGLAEGFEAPQGPQGPVLGGGQ